MLNVSHGNSPAWKGPAGGGALPFHRGSPLWCFKARHIKKASMRHTHGKIWHGLGQRCQSCREKSSQGPVCRDQGRSLEKQSQLLKRQSKVLQWNKSVPVGTKTASRMAVGLLLISLERCLNIYSCLTKGLKDCYFSLQLHTLAAFPPDDVSHWNLLQRARDQLRDWFQPSCGTEARSTQMKYCKEAITTKQPQDSSLSFLECHRSSTIWANSVKETVTNQKKNVIWTHSSKTTLCDGHRDTARHCAIRYAHTQA